jgi:cysteate synthase
MKDSKKQIEETYASVLTNLTPPYGIKGGLYDALVDTDGVMYAITRKEVLEAKVLFESLEGIHTASIRGCCRFPVKSCNIGTEDIILLNIAGGGYMRLKEDFTLFQISR